MPWRPPTAREVDAKPAVTPTAPPDKLQTEHDLYKHLYWRARWRHPSTGLAAACLRKHPICADPFREGCRKPSTQVHHKIDHHGDQKLFFDFNNLQGLCASCHSRITGSSHGKDHKQKPARLPVLIDGRINGESQR